MTKAEWKIELEKKSKEGYLTHSMLLDIYEEDEEIPDYVQYVLYSWPEKPKPIIIYTGLNGMKQWESIWENLLKQYKNE